jgi:hypothetical protein
MGPSVSPTGRPNLMLMLTLLLSLTLTLKPLLSWVTFLQVLQRPLQQPRLVADCYKLPPLKTRLRHSRTPVRILLRRMRRQPRTRPTLWQTEPRSRARATSNLHWSTR